jgi:glyoxylase-like metal-dependent hydrolase (beta-lactamase superfamily II)
VKVIRLEVGPLASNAYIVRAGGDEAAPGAVIDPGAEGGRIVARCREEKVEPRFIVNTHGHVDHVGADAAVKEAFPEALLCIGTGDAAMLADAGRNLSAFVGAALRAPAPDRELAEGDALEFAELKLKVLETPGHTPGGICLLADQEEPPQLFCGDLIFHQGVGRTDFPGGSWEELMASIRRKVLALPDETVLWPGHGPPTTVGAERGENPFLA